MYRAIFFDLDDTLFDRTAALQRWVAAQVGAIERSGFAGPRSNAKHCGGVIDGDDLAFVIELDDRGRRPRLHFAAGIVARFGIQRTVTELAAAFPAELAAQVEPEPGVRDVITRLAEQRRVAIVTNGGAAQRDKLARAGLADVVETVFVSGELGVAKPAPAIFERALAWSQLPARECLFVGDDPENDIAPAAALGMATAWRVRAAWPGELASPQFTIRSIGELEAHA